MKTTFLNNKRGADTTQQSVSHQESRAEENLPGVGNEHQTYEPTCLLPWIRPSKSQGSREEGGGKRFLTNETKIDAQKCRKVAICH